MASEVFEFEAVNGQIYAHVFENRTTGVPLGLYWNMYAECGAIEVGGEEWPVGVSCDWLQWPISNWRELDGVALRNGGVIIEPQYSVYIAEHHPAQISSFLLSRASGANNFNIAVSGRFTLSGFGSADGENLEFSLRGVVDFGGVFVLPDNVFPKPACPEDAENLVKKFISTQNLAAPEWDRFRYILKPV
jgi:hypothetical protein